jgi:hypothetical protein
VRAEPDLRTKIRMFAEGLAQRQARSAKVWLVAAMTNAVT